MGKRQRRRRQEGSGRVETTEYRDAEGNVLELRNALSAGTVAKLREGPTTAAALADDAWRRRQELLFERLAVRWDVAGAEPLTRQKELLARYRFASSEERHWIRDVLRAHLAEHFPEMTPP